MVTPLLTRPRIAGTVLRCRPGRERPGDLAGILELGAGDRMEAVS